MWIESHQELGRHPKLRRLARLLRISLPTAVGHLHYLWWWALDYAQDGDLSRYEDDELADAALWEGDPGEFVRALMETGFVDPDRQLHDWSQYTGRLRDRRRGVAHKRSMRQAYAAGIVEAVRQRDGDMCRYCGRRVNWHNRRGPDGGTYDLVAPDAGATVENLVVCCRACSQRKGGLGLDEAGMVLLPPPGRNQNGTSSGTSSEPVPNQVGSSSGSSSVPNEPERSGLTKPNLTRHNLSRVKGPSGCSSNAAASGENGAEAETPPTSEQAQEKPTWEAPPGWAEILDLVRKERFDWWRSPTTLDMIARRVEEQGADLVREAILLAIQAGADGWRYCEAILDAWSRRGITTVEEARADAEAWRRRRRHVDKPRDAPAGEKQMPRAFASLLQLREEIRSGGGAL